MTSTIPTTIPTLAVESAPLETVTFDFFAPIHKGIRNELFAVTFAVGRVDPADGEAVAALAGRWRDLSGLLVAHAEHEDTFVQPLVEQHAPALAVQIGPAHAELEARIAALELLADRCVDACPGDRHLLVHRLYLGVAGFTSAYLAHQEFEELEVMPALAARVDRDELIAVDMAIVASLSPEEMVQSATVMLPAMNVDDRVVMVGAMKADMPAEVFAGVWGLVESVLEPADVHQLATRIGVA